MISSRLVGCKRLDRRVVTHFRGSVTKDEIRAERFFALLRMTLVELSS